MLLLKIDRHSREKIPLQIANQIARLIDNGTLAPGDKLPPSRRLADVLGVNRTTVTTAYQELWALGYVESRPGSYTTVRRRTRPVAVAGPADDGRIDWASTAVPTSERLYRRSEETADCHTRLPAGCIDFSRLDMDARLFPATEFRHSLNRVLVRHGDRLLRYGDPLGYRPLREFVAVWSRTHGMELDADEILITNGSQQGLDLVFRFLTRPDNGVCLESPTYANVLPLLDLYGVRALEIPIRTDGLDLAWLLDIMDHERPAFLYTMPNFHNPTGISTSQAHRESLLAMCERHRLPLVEDGFEEEMKYMGKVSLPIKSMDRHRVVIYLGTFSKILFPGVRLGWVAADRECVRRLAALKRMSDLSTSGVLQAAMVDFCRGGHYEIHIRRMHREFRRRMAATLGALSEYLPRPPAVWNTPAGGYNVWVELLRPPAPEREFHEMCRRQGVAVSPGCQFFVDNCPGVFFRLCISLLDENQVRTGISRLGDAIRQFYGLRSARG